MMNREAAAVARILTPTPTLLPSHDVSHLFLPAVSGDINAWSMNTAP